MSTLFISGSFPENSKEFYIFSELDYIQRELKDCKLLSINTEYKVVFNHDLNKVPRLNEGKTRLRNLFFKHFWLLAIVFFYELVHSKTKKYYLKRPIYHIKYIFFCLIKAYEINCSVGSVQKIYTYWIDNDSLTISLYKKIFSPKAFWFSRAHGFDVDLRQRTTKYFIFRNYYGQFIDLIGGISEFSSRYTINSSFAFKDKVETFFLGLDENDLSPIPKSDSDLIIVSASSLIPLKRIDLMAKYLLELNLSIKWNHFGDGPELEKVKEILSSKASRVEFIHHGYIENKDLLNFYHNNPIDLLFNTSNLEGLPFSMIEATSFGIPICGFNICGIPEIINENNGIILHEESSFLQNVADLKMYLLGGKTRDSKYRQSIKELNRKKFDAKTNYTQVLNRLQNEN